MSIEEHQHLFRITINNKNKPLKKNATQKAIETAATLEASPWLRNAEVVRDSLDTNFSFLKFLLTFSNHPAISDWFSSEEGIAITSLSSIAMTSLAGLSTNNIIRNEFYSNFRNFFKGFKNAFNSFTKIGTIESYIKQHPHYWDNLQYPVGIGLGLVAGLVRIEMRKLADQRRKLLKEHVALLEEVKKRKNLDGYEYEYYLKRLDSLKEPMKDRCISMILTVFDSTINTFYYFISITSLSLLETAEGVVCSIPLSFAFMLNTCIIYSVMNVITSINTEYYEQQRLIVAKEKVKLALVGNKCIANITRYIEDMQGEQGSQHRAYYLKKIRENVQEFKKERHLLQKKMTQPWLAAILTGLNEGLYIYNGVSAFMFTTITILNIFSAGIPAMLLLSGIGIGLGITLIGMLKGALYRHIHVMHQELVENALEKRHFRKLSDATPVLTEEAIAFFKEEPELVTPMKSFSLVIGEMLRSVASGKDKGFRIPQLFTGEYQYSEENKGQLIGMILLGLALAALRFTKAFSRGLKPAIEEEPQKTSSNTPNKALSFSSSPTKQLGFFDKNKKRPAFVSMEQDANSVVNVSITSN